MEGRETKPPPPNPAMPYREDCWSEGATAALIEAWGDRYIELNRGNLRQKHWQEVADAVNSRRGAARRPPRTDVQCKNRIDTLKKKYKTEKTKIVDGAVESQWPFYSRLDALIGDSFPAKKPPPPHPPSPPLALPLTFHRKGSPLPAAAVAAAAAAAAARPMDSKEKRPAATALPVDDAFFRRNYSAAVAAAAERESESSSRSSVERSRSSRERSSRGWKRRREGYGEGFRQLARAIVRLAEVYEKIEEEKQQQMIDLEKQRMEFAKGLEFQRMQIFVDSQVQLEKIKRSKRVDAGEHGSSSGAIHFLFGSPVFNV